MFMLDHSIFHHNLEDDKVEHPEQKRAIILVSSIRCVWSHTQASPDLNEDRGI